MNAGSERLRRGSSAPHEGRKSAKLVPSRVARRMTLALGLIAGFGGAPALAQEVGGAAATTASPGLRRDAGGSPALDQARVQAYCRYVEAVADSTSALLLSPTLFANLGTLPGGALITDDGGGVSQTGLRARVQLGISVNPTQMYRGFVTRDLARAECRRYGSAARVQLDWTRIRTGGEAALTARARILEDALKRGREMKADLARKLEASLATVEEYGALSLKLDVLDRQLVETRQQLTEVRAAAAEVSTPAGDVDPAQAEDEVQRLQGNLRRSQAFEIELRGGYDRIFGRDQKIPAFGLATLSFSPGWFWQGPAEHRARQAHREWISAQGAELALTEEAAAQVRERLEQANQRLATLGSVLADLEKRRAEIANVPGERAKRYGELLWLELATLRAERAFLSEYGRELRGILQKGSAPAR